MDEKRYVSTQERLHYLLDDKVLHTADNLKANLLSWSELIDFNDSYIAKNSRLGEVEEKLLWGFNQTLREKALLQP
jgi:hypothetical protein